MERSVEWEIGDQSSNSCLSLITFTHTHLGKVWTFCFYLSTSYGLNSRVKKNCTLYNQSKMTTMSSKTTGHEVKSDKKHFKVGQNFEICVLDIFWWSHSSGLFLKAKKKKFHWSLLWQLLKNNYVRLVYFKWPHFVDTIYLLIVRKRI